MDLALGSAMPIETGAVRRRPWQEGKQGASRPSFTLPAPDILVHGRYGPRWSPDTT